MVKKFLDFINSNNLFDKTDKILVTVSGGIDSVVLAMLFKEAGLNFGIAHCNFHLRGEESNADEAFVRTLAEANDVECYVKSFDVASYARLHHVSTQMAARDLRYPWFRTLADERGFDYIATAHHLDDSIETTIFNLAKGTGVSGLRGILPKANKIIRPLLFTHKDELLNYAKSKNLSWREDSSNLSTKYNRNLIRHKIIPLLKTINPSLEDTFIHTQQRLAETAELVKQQAREIMDKYAFSKEKDLYITRKGIKNTNAVVTEELLKPFGFNYFQAKEIFTAAKGSDSVGKHFIGNGYKLNIDRENIIISPVIHQITEHLINPGDKEAENEIIKLKFETSENTGWIHTKKEEVSLDYNRLKFPLKLRKWKAGDRFQPLGMKGKKKLSDFMIDEKIPLNLKERVCVLESEGQVVWIIGYRIDDRFKVNADTRKVLNVVMSGNDQSL